MDSRERPGARLPEDPAASAPWWVRAAPWTALCLALPWLAARFAPVDGVALAGVAAAVAVYAVWRTARSRRRARAWHRTLRLSLENGPVVGRAPSVRPGAEDPARTPRAR